MSATVKVAEAEKLIAERKPDEEYAVTHWDGHFYILTNADGAVDFNEFLRFHGVYISVPFAGLLAEARRAG